MEDKKQQTEEKMKDEQQKVEKVEDKKPKTEKEKLVEEISFLISDRVFNPSLLYDKYKRLNKICICENVYNNTPNTMDPEKIKNHWSKSYPAFLKLKPGKKVLDPLKVINDTITSDNVFDEIKDVYSYKNIINGIIFALLSN